MGETIVVTEKQDSIEISKNAKGEYAFKIKIYYDSEVQDWQRVINRIEDINSELKGKFIAR